MLNDYLLLMLALPAVGFVYMASVVMSKVVTGIVHWLEENL